MLDAATHRKTLSAELAGTAPCLIFADADLDQATDSVLFGAFALNGQRAHRHLGHPGRAPRLRRPSSAAWPSGRSRIRVGDPSDPATQIGPLVHAEHYDKLTSCVRLGVREGARLAAGGRRPAGLPEGNYLAATVLADVAPSMQIFAEQICGPVVRVTPFDTEEEAVSLANAVAHPTAAYIWTVGPAASAPSGTGPRVGGQHLGELQQPTGPAVAAAGRSDKSAGDIDIDFYTQSRTVLTAADDTPVPRFGA